jgi:hypothetical protein
MVATANEHEEKIATASDAPGPMPATASGASWRQRLEAARDHGGVAYSAAAAARDHAMSRGAEAAKATWQSSSEMVRDVDALGLAECGIKWAGMARCLRDDDTTPMDCLSKLPRDSKCYTFVQKIVDRVEPTVVGFDRETTQRCELEWSGVQRCIASGGASRECLAQVPRSATCYHFVVDRWARDQMKKLPGDVDAEAALKCGVRWAGVGACLGAGGNFTCLAGVPQDSQGYGFLERALGKVRDEALGIELGAGLW